MDQENNYREYGSCPSQGLGGGNAVASPTKGKSQGNLAKPGGPMFLENPDGSITEAVPSGYDKEARGRSARGQRLTDAEDSEGSTGNRSEAAATSMYQEVDFLYTRHARIFVCLLTTQIILDALYGVVYILKMQPSLNEFLVMYNGQIQPRFAEAMFWVIFALQVVYVFAYYMIAGSALWTRKPKQFEAFANWSLIGTVGLVLLAYVDKFNLPIFFLRLLSYIYSRFLQGLTASLMLLPAPGQAQTPV